MKSKNLIDAQFIPTKKQLKSDALRPSLYGSQPAAFKALRKSKHVILNAPTGWGKSLVIVNLILEKLLADPKLRCVIAVPQTVIANGFLRDWVIRKGNKDIQWCVDHNFCDGVDTVRNLAKFLQGPNPGLSGRIAVCTHATLAKGFKKNRKLFKNVVVWIDEAHHVMNAQVQDSKDVVSNSIGALVKHCLEGTNTHMGMATATFMRGDRYDIIPAALEDQFTRHDIPYDVYFETMQPVENFTFDVICGPHLNAVDRIFKKKKAPTIIYLAKRNSRYATGCKYKEVKDIIKKLANGGKITREGDLIIADGLKILDLVTEEGRDSRKAFLNTINTKSDLDVIISLDMCKEGFDWIWAERSIIIGERHSIPEMIQMIGRLFRRAEGKKKAEVYQVMPAVVQDANKFKDHRNNILTVIFSAMLLEDVFLPVQYTGQKKGGTKLAAGVANTKDWQELNRDFLVAVQGRTYEQSIRFRKSTLNKHGIPEKEHEEYWKKLWVRWAATTQKMKGISVKKLDFSVLKNMKLADGLLAFCSDLCGVMTFKELRSVIGRETKTLEEWVEIAEHLAIENAAGRLVA